MKICAPWRRPKVRPEVRGKYAYVITLWGSSADYLIGAMVLGHSLRRTGSKHARICLHTADVPPGYIKMLSALWECRCVEHVSACTDKLSFQDDQPHRFDKVFTKLRVMSLIDFEKVLMMDIDLIVLSSIDELFALNAPAALRRGMNDSRWPLKTGDPVEGRPFFGGRDKSNKMWSWGQGTGINAGVMLLQPDLTVLNDMLLEIAEPNHPAHARGNGPEQDFLSRYWADAPWTYIGVEYNFQLHQMFFALHPNWASNAERGSFFRSPEKIKVVHFSGVPEAKPWHRVLDEKFIDYWPQRSRDAEYTTLFADEFLGHWLWIRKDPATWGGMPSRHGRAEMEDLYLGEDGQIWKKAWEWGSQPTCVEIPGVATQGAMSILSRSLESWFDCFEELQQTLGTDLKQDIVAAAGASKKEPAPPPPRQVQKWKTSGTADVPVASTGGTDSVASLPKESSSEAMTPAFKWKRMGGWWAEESRSQHERLTVVCGAIHGKPFVSFCEGGLETFGERDDDALTGLFVKVAGNSCARNFLIPEPAAQDNFTDDEMSREQMLREEEMLSEYQKELTDAVSPISIWVDGVPLRSAVLVAMIGLHPEAIGPVLAALAPLGVPTMEGTGSDYRAFSAVGYRPEPAEASAAGTATGTLGWFGEKRGNARPSERDKVFKKQGELQTWGAAHASRDFAYASMPFSTS